MTTIAAKTIQVTPRRGRRDPDSKEVEFQTLKVALHNLLVDSLNLSEIENYESKEFSDEISTFAREMCELKASHLNQDQRERMQRELMDEVFGLGPLEALMQDESITDILVNHPYEVFIERGGRLELTDVIFADEDHVRRVTQRLTARVGRRIDDVTPMVDARLPDGSRINAVVPPLSIQGPALSIRRFSADPLRIDDLVGNGTLSSSIAEFLIACVDSRVSFLVSGGAGAGKTTLLNALSEYVPDDERLITVEDSVELQLNHKHVVQLETRTNNTEGVGAITQRELVRNALRMRPDRIIVGEVRGGEALDMLQAMNSGHAGSLSTIHANDTREALARLEMMVAMAGFNLPVEVVRQYIAAGIQIIVHVARLKGGQRRVMRISEIAAVESGDFVVRDLFSFHHEHNGSETGHFYAAGNVPACLQRLWDAGNQLPESLFHTDSSEVAGQDQ
jgi:pilus assembly protein CpaF